MKLWDKLMHFFYIHDEITAWSIAITGTILIWAIGYLIFWLLGLIG